MGVPLRVLFIEDVEDDYLLVVRELQRGGFEVDSELVELPEEIEAALHNGPWDIVLSDYSLPRLDAMAALEIVQRHDAEIPVIIVSGTIGEDTAVAALQQGARDFMLKTNLARLVPAVTRALENARGRREQRAMEEALHASEERLRQAQKLDSIGRMAGGIAHDFNNVLSVIRGSAEFLIADIPASAARVEDATEIRDAAERASRLVSQLLAFSGRRLIEPRPLDVNTLVASVESLLRRLIPESVTILTEPTAALPTVLADEGQLEQVLVNLVVNARDAMPAGGVVRIATSLRDNINGRDPGLPRARFVALSVTDTGVGMDDAVLERIFEPFFTTKQPGRGTGLGLSTVYGIVQQSEGQVRVDSTPGAGTTFEVLLPESGEALQPRVTEPTTGSLRGTETVLLVDDEPPVRTVARRILQRAGYTVLEAADGVAALEIARREGDNIDVLVTDLVMPGIGGVTLASEVRELAPNAEIVLMSGYSHEDPEAIDSVAGAHSFLAKPFDSEALLHRMRVVLDRREREPGRVVG